MTDSERVQYKFMIPADLKARLENAAHERRRSLSAEIISRLEGSFLIDPALDQAEFEMADLRRQVVELADYVRDVIRSGKDPEGAN